MKRRRNYEASVCDFAAVLIPSAYGQKQPSDPNQFPETVKVDSETKETNDGGDTLS
jgi:hypothetical protein